MIARPDRPSVTGMDEQPPDGDSRPVAKVVGGVLTLAVVVAVFFLTRRLTPADLPDLPDLPFPDLPDWLGPILKWGKLVVLAVIGALAVIGQLELRRRRRDRPGDDDVQNRGS